MKKYKIIENNIEYTIKVYTNGNKYWYLNGRLHREGGPAIEYANGTKKWFYQDIEYKVKSNKEFLRLMKIRAFL